MGLKDWFIKNESESKARPEVVSMPTGQVVPPVSVPTVSAGQSSTDYSAYLEAVFTKNKEAKQGYAEYRDALNKLQAKPLQEAERYQYAFMSFEALGLTPSQLVQSVEYYLSRMEELNMSFHKQLKEAQKTDVDDRKAQMEVLKQENIELTAKISKNNAQMQELNNLIFKAEQTLSSEQSAFESQYSAHAAELKQTISNIQTYLNANITK